MTTLSAINDRVIIQLETAPAEKTSGGLFLPDTARKVLNDRGTVTAVGPGRLTTSGTRIPVEVQIGDTVVFDRSKADLMEVAGVKYVSVEEKNLLCVL